MKEHFKAVPVAAFTIAAAMAATLEGTLARAADHPVIVTNDAANPVLTRDVDSQANEPIEFNLCEGTGAFGSDCAPSAGAFVVPATSPTTGKTVKRLVAEYVSGYCLAASDTYVTFVGLVRRVGTGNGLSHRFVP